MQKSGLIIVIFGLLIVTGLVVSIVENQITLEGINQGNGKVSSIETVTISVGYKNSRGTGSSGECPSVAGSSPAL